MILGDQLLVLLLLWDRFLGKLLHGVLGHLLHLRTCKVLLTALNTWMSSVPCCKKVFILHRFVPCSENLVISREELTYQEPQCRLLFHMLVVLDKEVLMDLTCGIKFWTMHLENQLLAGSLRRLVSHWQPTIADSRKEGAVPFLMKTWMAPRNRCFTICAGRMICMQWLGLLSISFGFWRTWPMLLRIWICGGRRKAWKSLLDPTPISDQVRPSKLWTKEAENTSGTWRRAWKRWAHGWTVVAVLRQVCGTGFRRATLCSMRKRPFSVTPKFQSASASQRFIQLACLLCFMGQENGLLHKVCSNRCVLGSWVNYAASFAFVDDQMRAGLIIWRGRGWLRQSSWRSTISWGSKMWQWKEWRLQLGRWQAVRMMLKAEDTGRRLWLGDATSTGRMRMSNCQKKTTVTACSGKDLRLDDVRIGKCRLLAFSVTIWFRCWKDAKHGRSGSPWPRILSLLGIACWTWSTHLIL